MPTTSVRYHATLHDVMMLNPVRGTRASSAAVEQAAHVLRQAPTDAPGPGKRTAYEYRGAFHAPRTDSLGGGEEGRTG